MVAGLVLAAGAGRRMGTPKALLRMPDGTPWVARAVSALRGGGCADVTVVLGAEFADAATLLDDFPVRVVEATDWAAGMSASLRAGLTHLLETSHAPSAAVTLVDLPDVDRHVVCRVIDASGDDPEGLRRAAYRGMPGHPVLLGRHHWGPVAAGVGGDSGARDYLDRHGVVLVECGDLASGRDIDTRGSLPVPDGRET